MANLEQIAEKYVSVENKGTDQELRVVYWPEFLAAIREAQQQQMEEDCNIACPACAWYSRNGVGRENPYMHGKCHAIRKAWREKNNG
jgi:hypothetical protein